MPAILFVALPLPATPKGVTKWAFIYVKRAKAKHSVISYLRVPRVRNGQCKQFHARRGFMCQQPKMGKNIWATKLAFIYVKRAKAKNSVISYLRVPRVRNDQCNQFEVCLYPPRQQPHISRWLTLTRRVVAGQRGFMWIYAISAILTVG